MPVSEPHFLLVEGPDGALRITPPLYGRPEGLPDPADLTAFAPQGNVVYGLQEQLIDPFKAAPRDEAEGGLVFFDNDVSEVHFMGMLHALKIALRPPYVIQGRKDYAVFFETSENPHRDGYLTQVRVASKFALRYLYGVIDDVGYQNFPEQTLELPEFLWGFIRAQRREWGTRFGSAKLAGTFGGDGHFAQEQLAFGLMVENSYHHIYRIWSRAWLVTK